MSSLRVNTDLYTSGTYAERHPDWGLDGRDKADDIAPFLERLTAALTPSQLRIAEVGAGTGSVLFHTVRRLQQRFQGTDFVTVGYDISRYAIELGRKHFPEIGLRNQEFGMSEGPYDIILFIDVLEHLENPWDMLRRASAAANFLLVRQPLLGNFSTFRHNNYRAQRVEWGHIGFYDYRSFLDMAEACRWRPRDVRLTAPWELSMNKATRASWIKLFAAKVSRIYASQFISGFYLLGVFDRTEERRGTEYL